MSESVAISLSNVSMVYRLYDSLTEQALDVFGLSALRFWRKPRYHQHPALSNVNLQIRRGERIGILGRNGAGKTTLLKVITGNFALTSGSVTVNGTLQALMNVGLGFHPEFTGYENIRAALEYNGLERNQLEVAIEDIIGFVELGDFLHQPMKTYSLGMQTRLMFATATAVNPDILIVDEVLGAGDAYFSAKSSKRMEALANSGCTLLLVSHSMPQVLQYCNRAIWLENGSVHMEGDALEVVQSYEVAMRRTIEKAQSDQTKQQGRILSEMSWIRQGKNLEASIGVSLDGREIATSLEDGRRVYRWPSYPGVKVAFVTLRSGDRPTGIVVALSTLEIDLGVRLEESGRFRLRYNFALSALDGRRIAQFFSPVDAFEGHQGELRMVRAIVNPLLVGAGEYLLSVSVFDDNFPMNLGTAKRYDLLAKSFELKVLATDHTEPPAYHQPADWSFSPVSCDGSGVQEEQLP